MESVSGLPLKFETRESQLELRQFTAFGEKQFPKTFRLTHGGKTIIEVELESLAELDPNKPEAFVVPAGAASYRWCSDMVGPLPTRLGEQSPSRIPSPPPNAVALPWNMDITKFSVLLFRVDGTGAVSSVRGFAPGGEVLLKDREKSILLKSTFKPATCNGAAIEAEFPMDFHFPVF